MREYVLRRILLMIPTLLGVTVLVFMLTHLVPGDVVMVMVGESAQFDPENVEKLRQQLGLDKSLPEQYSSWVGGVVRGDLGKSLWTGRPVSETIMERLPVTFELALLAIAISSLLAILVGVISAIRQDTPIDYIVRVMSIGGLSVPEFWIATLIIVFPAIWFNYLPPMRYTPIFVDPWANLQQFGIPAFTMGVRMSAGVMRMTRSQMLEVLRQDYIRTAWAKGLRERVVIYRHALKNALIPVITMMGTQFSSLMGGTVIVESIFSLPGVGRLMLDSIQVRDYTQLQGNVLFLAIVFLTMNLIVDLTYAWLDPRINY